MEERIPLKNITDEHADAFADICKFKKDQPKSPLQNAIDRKAEARRILTDEKTGSHFMGEWRNLIEGLKFLYINGYDIPLFYNITASPPSMPDLETCKDKVLEIIQKNYNEFKGTNEAELHSSHEIANWMCSQCDVKQKAVEFADFIYTKARKGYKPDCWFTGTTNDTKQFTTEELYEIFNQQER